MELQELLKNPELQEILKVMEEIKYIKSFGNPPLLKDDLYYHRYPWQKFGGLSSGICECWCWYCDEYIYSNTTADDGLKCYGKTTAKVSLLTCDLYRKFVYVIDKYKLDKWWWLSTAYSTALHGYEKLVKGVSPRGSIDYDEYGYGICGVRPFCILKSNIFVS